VLQCVAVTDDIRKGYLGGDEAVDGQHSDFSLQNSLQTLVQNTDCNTLSTLVVTKQLMATLMISALLSVYRALSSVYGLF